MRKKNRVTPTNLVFLGLVLKKIIYKKKNPQHSGKKNLILKNKIKRVFFYKYFRGSQTLHQISQLKLRR